MTGRLLPSGDAALLVECGSLDEVLALHDALSADRPPGLVELVPAARTVLVAVDPDRFPLESVATWVRRAQTRAGDRATARGGEAAQLRADDRATARAGDPAQARAGDPAQARVGDPAAAAGRRTDDAERAADTVTVRVAYDGDDLVETADLLGWSVESLVARHTGARWRVAFGGFAPGFGYLVSDDWPVEVPRLAAPRTRVPAGAVALAGAFSGVYPRESPGGWRLVGRTDAELWNPDRPRPALLEPGRRVRFEAVR